MNSHIFNPFGIFKTMRKYLDQKKRVPILKIVIEIDKCEFKMNFDQKNFSAIYLITAYFSILLLLIHRFNSIK
jgi:hypothetical protein